MQHSLICHVQMDSTWPGCQVGLPKRLFKQLSCKPGTRMRIKISSQSVHAVIRATTREEVVFSNRIGQRLHFQGGRISVRKKGDTLEFGPVIALYVVGSPENQPPFPNMTRMVCDTIRIGEEKGMYVYAVIPGGISVREQRAFGARGTSYDKWIWCEQPYPDIVIRKAATFPKGVYRQAKTDLNILDKSGDIMFMAKDIGDKWSVYRWLWNYEPLRKHLPYTELYKKQSQQVVDLLEQYQSLYVKPVRGTQGKGIYKLTNGKHNGIIRIENTAIPSQMQKIKRTDLLKNKQMLPISSQSYLLQQSLHLLKHQNHLTDFRWMIQKLPNQNWEITARICRIGREKTISTNIHTGGQAVLAEQWLYGHSNLLPRSTKEILEEMDEIARSVAVAIDQKVGGVLELGVDLGVDRNGRIWIIEVNPRPGRKMLRLCQPEVRQLSLLRPLEYAKYAKGF
ncbi:YheC/YheD family protein [Fodinisporobacter ferrooxydans]|uniref:YheC/YheD family protein n=1 Tax=Fodinisporobacter ferrooxydans TaxID=2901836 RepID=A0ABY4CGL1_9BACL|nr:YheC/YheD family protein [Alicyclobacillaceae bacterium MYW30-H2]